MFLHSQCIVYVVLLLVMTVLGLRSAFVLLFALLVYSLTTFINLFTRFQSRGTYFCLALNRSLNDVIHFYRIYLDTSAFCRSNNSFLVLCILCNLLLGYVCTHSRPIRANNESRNFHCNNYRSHRYINGRTVNTYTLYI